jgi:hypothetical protein
MNPLLVVSLPGLGLLLLRRSWGYRVWIPLFALAVMLLYAILRNLPIWPFDLLAPK